MNTLDFARRQIGTDKIELRIVPNDNDGYEIISEDDSYTVIGNNQRYIRV